MPTPTNYSINGVNLGRGMNSMGWAIMRAGTDQLAGITRSLNKVTVPGYDGYFRAPSDRTEQMMIFNIRTPRENLESLLAVLAHTGYDANHPGFGVVELSIASGKASYFELASAIPAPSDHPSDSSVKVTATLSIPHGAWRDVSPTTTTTTIDTNPKTISAIGSGISLPIRDADIFIQGNVGSTIQITDSAGSWLRTSSAYSFSTGYGVFYQGSTGRAFQATNASPWVPTGDLGYAVDASGGGGFRMTPKFDPTTPDTRAVELTVLSTLLSSVSLKVRWRGAYVLK